MVSRSPSNILNIIRTYTLLRSSSTCYLSWHLKNIFQNHQKWTKMPPTFYGYFRSLPSEGHSCLLHKNWDQQWVLYNLFRQDKKVATFVHFFRWDKKFQFLPLGTQSNACQTQYSLFLLINGDFKYLSKKNRFELQHSSNGEKNSRIIRDKRRAWKNLVTFCSIKFKKSPTDWIPTCGTLFMFFFYMMILCEWLYWSYKEDYINFNSCFRCQILINIRN